MCDVHLHEEAGAERSADVDVVISAGELRAPAGQVEAVHDSGQLLPHVVSRHQWTVVDKVVIAPLVRLVVWKECNKDADIEFFTLSKGDEKPLMLFLQQI